ncbi:MAG: Hpt domain-containing protein [Moraxellaceae bacterium]|nr:Hpt domain-containing protein [Pseudobdellovibrionaceae bacterium]
MAISQTEAARPQTEVEVDPDILELVPGFCESRKRDLKNLNDYAAGNDFVAISKVSHTIKGIARPYGFPTLEILAVKLEKAAKEENSPLCLEILNSAHQYFKAYSK